MTRRDFLERSGLAAGSLLVSGAAAAGPGFVGKLENSAYRLEHDGRPVLTYQHAPVEGPAGIKPLFTRGAYLHPVHAPNGAVLTDDFPADHLHQRGVFFAWTKTQLGDLHPDFWNIGEGTGRIRSTRLDAKTESGKPARFQTQHVWEARRGEAWEAALDESWEVTVHVPRLTNPQAPDAYYLIDLTSRQTPKQTLELPQHRYGGMCVRGARPWMDRKAGMAYLTSEGKGLPEAENARARWVDMSGPLGGKEVGIALLEHPTNLRAPNLLRVPPENPYYVYSPSKGEPLTLQAGREYVFRYRLVAHNGRADARVLDELWKAFAAER